MSTTITRGRPPATLAGYSDEELCDFYNASTDEAWQATLTAEMDRRDREEHAPAAFRRSGPARRDPVRAEWHDAAHAQYLAASADLNGELVRRGSHVRSDFELWRGSETFALANCTEELRLWWQRNPRVTVTAYRDQVRAQREAYRYDAMDADGTGPVRHERAASAGSTVPGGGSVRDAGHGGPDRSGRAVRRDEMEAGQISTGPSLATQRLMRNAEAINAERDRRAAGDTLAGEQDGSRVTEPPEAYRRSQGAVALRPEGHVLRADRAPVNGAQTLMYARRFLGHFAVWPSEAALTTVTLWCAHCWARDASKTLVFQATPRLLFSSVEPGSGKSAAMKLTSRLCPSPSLMTEPSEPAVAHSIGDRKTLFLDEIDVLFGTNGTRKSAIRAVINDGYTPEGSWPRVRNGVTHEMPTFGPLGLAGLDKVESGTSGVMAATLSRCIRVRMRKAAPDYRAPRFDDRARLASRLIGEEFGAWCQQELPLLGSHVPVLPDGIGNREAELWEPLLTVADVAGGDWPAAARDACEELVATGGMPEQDEDVTSRIEDIMAGWED